MTNIASSRMLLYSRALFKNFGFIPLAREGFCGDFKCYCVDMRLDQNISRIEKEGIVDDVAKIRSDFNAAKQSFMKIPLSCLKFKYDHTFPIRGLCYDKSKGCLLKLDFFGSIELDGCYFGRRKVEYSSEDEHFQAYDFRTASPSIFDGLVLPAPASVQLVIQIPIVPIG